MEVFYPGLEIFRKGYGHMVVCPVVDGETAQEQSVFPAVGVVEVASAQEQLVAASGHRQLVLVSVGVFKLRLPVGRQHRLCFVAGELEGRVSLSSVLNTVSSAGAAMDFGAAHRHAAMHMAVTTDAVACRVPLF